jgi:hypothetical protein
MNTYSVSVLINSQTKIETIEECPQKWFFCAVLTDFVNVSLLQTRTASPSTQKVSLSSLKLEPTVQGNYRPWKLEEIISYYVFLIFMLL